MSQKLISKIGGIRDTPELLSTFGVCNPLIVCNYIPDAHRLDNIFCDANISFTYFVDFSSNPLYSDVCKAIELFKNCNCDSIIAIGGGSAIDVAKCVKLFCKMEDRTIYLQQEFADSKIPLIAIPTTAGTGSESTKYAVIYFKGMKESITHESILPNAVVLDPKLLQTLPQYQKKCTMLDALCQGIESWWSVNSTAESKGYSQMAISNIVENMENYLANPDDLHAAQQIMIASNYAGKSINITQTTGPHAMSYKITSIYNLPHGHSVAVCLPKLWQYMCGNGINVTDPRGKAYLWSVFRDIAQCLIEKANPEDAILWFEELLGRLNIKPPCGTPADIEILANSVNPVRLKNNPVAIDKEAFHMLYQQIIIGDKQ